MKDLMNEANRCLLCKNPRCKQSCPINTENPTIISLYKEGKIKEGILGNSHYAIDYLRSPQKYDLGENVVVIGVGNVAMDAARSAKYYGAKNVYLAYRRDFSDMTATKVEINDEGIEELLKCDSVLIAEYYKFK